MAAPQAEQATSSFPPHSSQNRTPSRFSNPHWGQRISCAASSSPPPAPDRTACHLAVPRMRLVSPREQSAHAPRPTGSVNVNVDPCPTWLLTQMRPPCNSTNFRREREAEPRAFDLLARPSRPAGTPRRRPPGPRARCPPRCRHRDLDDPIVHRHARTSIRPPSGVNLIALESRFSTTCLIFRSSARTSPSRGSDRRLQRDPLAPGPLADEGHGVVDSRGQVEVRQLELHLPRLDLGEVEDVVDQRQLMLGGGVDLLQIGDERRPAAGPALPPAASPSSR